MNATPPDDTPDADPPETDAPGSRPDAGPAWAPATDAGVPGDEAEARPPRKVARKPAAEARKAKPPAKANPAKARPAKDEAPSGESADAAAGTADPAPEPEGTPEGERIAKAIARAGIASRRDAEAMIAEGRVTLNGAVLDSPAVNVTEADRITVDGEPLPARERTRLWLFHKPRGLVTTARDPEGRQTVFETLPEDLPRVVAVGRLDINTEGLLLLTNDGGLAKVIAHPDTGWLRRYRVRAHGDTTQAELDRLRKGVTIDGMEYGAIEASLDRVQGDNLWLTLGLREGKNREVKRILEHLGLSVNRLIRLSFGPFQLGDLEPGLVEEVRTKVLKEQLGPGLSAQAEVDFASPVREPVTPFGSPKAAAREAAAASRGAARGPARQSERRGAPAGRGGAGAPAPARPPARVPTGGMGPGPRRSVWRADETGPAPLRPAKVPRRGADPKAERAAAAERGRERVGSIRAGERRVVVERLKASPPEPAPEPHRRTRFRTLDPETGARGRPRRAEAGEGRPAEARPARSGPRPERREAFPGEARPTRSGPRPERPAQDRPPRGERPFRDERPARGERPTRGERPFRDERPRGGFRDEGRPRAGARPGGARPEGEGRERRTGGPRGDFKGGPRGESRAGSRPGGRFDGRSEARPGAKFGAKPGGRPGAKPGTKPGGRPGPRSGGDKPGGRPGPRPGGKPRGGR